MKLPVGGDGARNQWRGPDRRPCEKRSRRRRRGGGVDRRALSPLSLAMGSGVVSGSFLATSSPFVLN